MKYRVIVAASEDADKVLGIDLIATIVNLEELSENVMQLYQGEGY